MLKWISLSLILVFCCAQSAAMAADDRLYPSAVDPSAAFLRVLAPGQTTAVIAGRKVALDEHGISPFVAIVEEQISVSWPRGHSVVSLTPAQHFTLLSAADGSAVLHQDLLALNPAKADVSLINLSGGSGVDLHVPLAQTDVLSGVSEATTETVALRAPLMLDFEVRTADLPPFLIPQVALQRKKGLTIIVTQYAGGLSAGISENRYEY